MSCENNRNRRVPICIHCLSYRDNSIYCFSEEYNQLYYVDLDSNDVHSLGYIPWEKKNGNRLIEKIVRVGNRLYLIPFSAEYLTFFDIANKTFDRIDFRNTKGRRVNGVFADAFTDGKSLFLIPGSAETIIQIDLNSHRITLIDEWFYESKNIVFDEKDGYFRSCGIIKDNCFITPFCNANALLVFDYHNLSYKIVKLGNDSNGYSGVVSKDDAYWLAPRKGDMYVLECDSDFNPQRKIEIEKSSYFSGIDAIDGIITIWSTLPIKHSYDEVVFISNAERISVDGNYRAQINNLDLRVTIDDHNGIVYEDTVRIPVNSEELLRWSKVFIKKGVIHESVGKSLELFTNSI